MRLAYVTDQWLPQPMTDTRQILNVVSAFGSIGLSVDLLVPRRRLRTGATVDELASYYQVQPTFHVRNVASVYPTMRGIEKVAHGLAATRLASRSRYDLLYTRNIPVLISALRLGRVPVVYETYRPWPSQRPGMGRLFRWMGGHGRFLGAVLHSRLAAGSYEAAGVPPERLLVAHNGHDPGMFEPALDAARARSRLGLPADARLAVYTGDIRPSKGIGLLLDMAVRVPDVRFILIGSSSEGAMERRARRIPNVDVLPRMPARDLVPFWFAADVLLIPPTRAPLARAGHTVLPFKTFEYMAAGRPILGPDTPDLREVLRDGESAALARPDDLDDAVHRLRTLMDDPQERARLSRACLERASGFTWTGRARAILSFLRRRLGSQD